MRERVNAPVGIVALVEILACMGAATFLARFCPVNRTYGVCHQVFEFQRFHQIGIPDQRTVGDLDVRQFLPDFGNALAAVFKRFLRAEHGGVFLHGALHLFAQLGSRLRAAGITQTIETGHDLVDGSLIDHRADRRTRI